MVSHLQLTILLFALLSTVMLEVLGQNEACVVLYLLYKVLQSVLFICSVNVFSEQLLVLILTRIKSTESIILVIIHPFLLFYGQISVRTGLMGVPAKW